MVELTKHSMLSRYLNYNMYKVAGWLRSGAAHLIAEIGTAQHEAGMDGDIFEIGAYHGQLTILLALMRESTEKITVCDIFDDRNYKYQQSNEGYGNFLQDFTKNIEKYCNEKVPNERFVILKNRSQELTEVVAKGDIRLFSIDGEHSENAVESDFKLAIKSISEKGCIIHDDFFNSTWPGVSIGVAKVLLEKKNEVAPFLVGFNKVFVCKHSSLSWYQSISESLKKKAARYGWSCYTTTLLGNSVMIIQDSVDYCYYTMYYEYLDRLRSWHFYKFVVDTIGKIKISIINPKRIVGKLRNFVAGKSL